MLVPIQEKLFFTVGLMIHNKKVTKATSDAYTPGTLRSGIAMVTHTPQM